MTGSGSDKAGPVSPTDLAVFKKGVRLAQLQLVLQRTNTDPAGGMREPSPRRGTCGRRGRRRHRQVRTSVRRLRGRGVPSRPRRRRLSCARELEHRHDQTAVREPRRRRPIRRGGACSDTRSGCPSPGSPRQPPASPANPSVGSCAHARVRPGFPNPGKMSGLGVGPGGEFGYGAAGASKRSSTGWM